jgi:hypothetical protein
MPARRTEDTTVGKVIAELNSGYREDSWSGPSKKLTGVALDGICPEPGRNRISAKLSISADYESPYGDYDSSDRVFEVTLEDLQLLAGNAPRYQSSFAQMARELEQRLAKDKEDYDRFFAAWCEAGAPTGEATAAMKPLRLRRWGPLP